MVLMTPEKKPSTRVRGKGTLGGWGPRSHPRPAWPPAWPGVVDTEAPPAPRLILPGRGTKLISIQRSPVTNVMIVNKPPAGHPGTTQAQTRCGGRAGGRAPTLSLGAGPARRGACWWQGITREQPSSLPFLARRERGGGSAMKGQSGVLPYSLRPDSRAISGLDGRRPQSPAVPPPPIPSQADVRSPIN